MNRQSNSLVKAVTLNQLNAMADEVIAARNQESVTYRTQQTILWASDDLTTNENDMDQDNRENSQLDVPSVFANLSQYSAAQRLVRIPSHYPPTSPWPLIITAA